MESKRLERVVKITTAGVKVSKEISGRSSADFWLRLLRPLWFAATVLALILFAAGVSFRYGQLLAAASANSRILADLGLSAASYAAYFTILDILLVFTHVSIAGLIFWQGSDNIVAVLVALALVTAPLAAVQAISVDAAPWQLVGRVILYIGLVSSMSLLYLFPDGRFIPPWTRQLAILWALLNLPAVFFATTSISLSSWSPWVQFALLAGWSATGIYAQVYRYIRVSDPIQRQQTKWALLGLSAATLGPIGYYFGLLSLPSLSSAAPPGIFYNLADPTVFQFATSIQLLGSTLYTLGLLLFPISFAVAILRYGLFDIQLVLNRSLVYIGLSALIASFYILIVGGLGTMFQAQSSLLLAVSATGVIAVLFDPLRARLQRSVNRFMYGFRDEPEAILNELGQKLDGALENETISSTIVETLARALRLPYAAIDMSPAIQNRGVDSTWLPPEKDSSPDFIQHGHPEGECHRLPLTYQEQFVGQLIISQRALGESFSANDWQLIKSVAFHASAALYTAKLAAELQRSRERLVTGLEEERRRLRRDLHDRLGGQLAALTLQADLAARAIAADPGNAQRLMDNLKTAARDSMAAARAMVTGLDREASDA